MGFNQKQAEQLLADTARRCCICGTIHSVQLHHIIPREDGGTDEIDNSIPLCPNCHDEVHGRYASGRTTRPYSANELKLHRQRTIQSVAKEQAWSPEKLPLEEDKALILFYAQCLDRPAFRMRTGPEMCFEGLNQAMEDTLIALNTGYWRTRSGTLLERSRGKVYVVNSRWRQKLDRVAEIIEDVRFRFHRITATDSMVYQAHKTNPDDFDVRRSVAANFRGDREWMDARRQEVIDIFNSILDEIGYQPLRGIHEG